MEHLGGTGFLTNLEDVYDETVSDRERECRFVQLWAERFGVGRDQEVPIEELRMLNNAQDNLLGLAASTGNEQSQRAEFGAVMRRLRGQVRCGKRVCRARKRSHYLIEEVKE